MVSSVGSVVQKCLNARVVCFHAFVFPSRGKRVLDRVASLNHDVLPSVDGHVQFRRVQAVQLLHSTGEIVAKKRLAVEIRAWQG